MISTKRGRRLLWGRGCRGHFEEEYEKKRRHARQRKCGKGKAPLVFLLRKKELNKFHFGGQHHCGRREEERRRWTWKRKKGGGENGFSYLVEKKRTINTLSAPKRDPEEGGKLLIGSLDGAGWVDRLSQYLFQ